MERDGGVVLVHVQTGILSEFSPRYLSLSKGGGARRAGESMKIQRKNGVKLEVTIEVKQEVKNEN